MNIRECTLDDAATLAVIIAESNRDVAAKFGLDGDNCPKHPSFCTRDWIVADMDRAVRYFMLEKDDMPFGCVAYESPNAEMAFLNRLSVLPAHRKLGCGGLLVRHIIDMASSASVSTVSIGIIGEHLELQRWYAKLGFIGGESKHFPHLPFTVKYMTYTL